MKAILVFGPCHGLQLEWNYKGEHVLALADKDAEVKFERDSSLLPTNKAFRPHKYTLHTVLETDGVEMCAIFWHNIECCGETMYDNDDSRSAVYETTRRGF